MLASNKSQHVTTLSITFIYFMKRIIFFNGLVLETTLRGKKIQQKTLLKINQQTIDLEWVVA